ncbi:MAG: 3-deoxy-D-manno-octulosonic acid transferase [Synoicihabitans sp.]
MFIWIYRLLFLPALLVIAPVLLWKSRHREGQWRGLKQRFGSVPPLPERRAGRKRLWLQAVSVGEVLAVEPVIRGLLQSDDLELVLTTSTSTGYRVAREKYAGTEVLLAYFPIDFWWCVARSWRAIAPDLFVLMEGERWPEHFAAASARGVPVVTINARISDRSFRRMFGLGGWARNLVRVNSRILAVGDLDRDRFVALGAPKDSVVVTGNIKLDTDLPELNAAERLALREELGFTATDTIVVGASTWDGEERALLAACRTQWDSEQGASLRLLLVPRHAERRAEILEQIADAGVSCHVRSQGAAAKPVQVCLADTTGELAKLVQLGAVVWIGKSLPPHTEGQTPVEAARLGCPILFGPGMGNFRKIAEDLEAIGAARQVTDAAEMQSELSKLLKNGADRQAMGKAGRRWRAANRGAKQRTLDALTQIVDDIVSRG